MRSISLLLLLTLVGCDSAGDESVPESSRATAPVQSGLPAPPRGYKTPLLAARADFQTKIVRAGDPAGPPETPPGELFELIEYDSSVGPLAAYLSKDPGDGKQHPAIVWITGGDNNSIGDVWTSQSRDNDQSVSAFRKAGIVMLFPSQRGGNDNPGQREGFYGEVDDILAATDHLIDLPYVDPDQIYLGGHSTGGTMVLIVAECSRRYRAIFSLGPVAAASHYGGDFIYCDQNNQKELKLRSPLYWLAGIKTPTYVFEGSDQGNWESIEMMDDANTNPLIQFYQVPGHDHFSVIAPVAELLAEQIVSGNVELTPETIRELR